MSRGVRPRGRGLLALGWLALGLLTPGLLGTTLAACSDAGDRGLTTGRLRLRTFPTGARVWIDGEPKIDATPATLFLPAGTYRLRLQLPGAEAIEREVEITAGESDEVDINVPRPPDATISVLSDEVGAKVSINGYTRGVTPLLDAVTKPGAVDMTLLTSDGRAKSVRTTLTYGEHKWVELFFAEVDCRPPPPPPPAPPPMSLPPLRGYLTLGLEPEGEVLDDQDERLGATPLERRPLEPGLHKLQLRSGKRHKWVEVEIEADRTAIYRFRLLPEDEPR